MPGDFWRSIDWDKMHEIAMERAKADLDAKPDRYKPDLTNIKQLENEIKEQIKEDYLFLLARHRYHMDYIWLMGPLPMKEGYEPPTFESTWLL